MTVALLLSLGAVAVFVPILSPAAGAATADLLRSVFGPKPVARLESLSFWMRDAIYRWLPVSNGAGPAVGWSSEQKAEVTLLDAPPSAQPVAEVLGTATPSESAALDPTETPVPQPTPTPILDALSAPPQIGWEAYGPAPDGAPLMARALIMVDPDRSYAGVALVRMDLSRLQLHIMAGNLEPAHPDGIDKLIADLGYIAPDDQSRVMAAFNGGFKAVHGHYGMMVNRVILLEPVDGMATLAVYEDGSVGLGAWGSDIVLSSDMVAFRQNCPPLVRNGELNSLLVTYSEKAWGITNTSDVTWRTGVGLTQDRRYLIYAVGNGTTVQFLAEALLRAGAYNGMELDINQYYAHFVTYSQGESELVAQRLLKQMINIRKLYLAPQPRDFFYLTLRP